MAPRHHPHDSIAPSMHPDTGSRLLTAPRPPTQTARRRRFPSVLLSAGVILCGALLVSLIAAPASAQPTQDYEADVRQLMSHPAVQAAMEHIEETDDQTPWPTFGS